MNAYDMARTVEARGMDALIPFLRQGSFEGRFVLTNKGALAEMLQSCVGDLLLNTHADGTIYSVELKVEEENRHGNLYLETWSNRNFMPRRVGWMYTQQADMLWYYFLREDSLYVFNMRRLWQWAHVEPSHRVPGGVGRMFDFPEKMQVKREQRNVTAGRCVPIAVLGAEVGFTLYRPQESGMAVLKRARPALEAA